MSLRSICAWTCLGLATPSVADAVPYEVFISARSENDLYDLLLTRQISEGSFDALLLLLQSKVDLNSATRDGLYALPNLDFADVDAIVAYREHVGVIRDPAELAVEGVLSGRIVDAMLPFVSVRSHDSNRGKGFVRLLSRWSGTYDRLPPASALQARVSALGHLDAGLVGMMTRNRVGRARWDPRRDGLSVTPERVRFEVPKAYLQWEDQRLHAVVGTFRIGFGERLTFDVTGQRSPDGALGDLELRRPTDLVTRCRRGAGELAESPCRAAGGVRVTPDFASTHRLTGFALGLKRLPSATGWFRGYVWASYQVRPVLQSGLVLGSTCTDARRDDEPGCEPPDVYVRGERPGDSQYTTSRTSLPRVFGEWLGGLHASHYWNDRTRVGVTGYGAVPRSLVRGVALDFQESERTPAGGAFGALGVSAAYGFARQGFFAEATRSFDRQPGGGGAFGVIVRSVTTWARGEVDVSVRYYDARFANPYARPVSAPDELDGLRARDEAGVRLQGTVTLAERVALRVFADGWRRLSSGSLLGTAYARLDVEVVRSVVWSVWGERRSASRRTSIATRLRYDATKDVSLIAQVGHVTSPRASATDGRQHDLAAVLTLQGAVGDRWRVRVRSRYDFEDVANNQRMPHSLRVNAETSWRLGALEMLELSYDLLVFLDERPSTRERLPNPQHQLWIELVFRY